MSNGKAIFVKVTNAEIYKRLIRVEKATLINTAISTLITALVLGKMFAPG